MRLLISKNKRREVNLLKFAGAWKGTDLDSDSMWKKILGKKHFEKVRGLKIL